MSLWLAKDQRSNEVVALQNALNVRLMPSKPLMLDGIFGPLTAGAVPGRDDPAPQPVEGLEWT